MKSPMPDPPSPKSYGATGGPSKLNQIKPDKGRLNPSLPRRADGPINQQAAKHLLYKSAAFGVYSTNRTTINL